MSEVVVKVNNLWQKFKDVDAVKGISFEINKGQVLGFIGANGAGKTTTMRIMSTLDIPTHGEVLINGQDVVNYRSQVRLNVGWMPDSYGVYNNMSVLEYLDFFARAYKIPTNERKERIQEVMEFTDLIKLSDRYIDTLSKGMKQRLCMGRMLVHDPDVLILDEPAAGLDPKARVEFKHLVRLLAEDGKAVFISSHILTELEDMCDSILFIDSGKLIYSGSSKELKDNKSQKIEISIKILGEINKLQEWISLNPGIELVESQKDSCRISLDSNEDQEVAKILKRLINDNFEVIEFRQHQRRLEDAFIDILENGEKS